MPPLYKWIKDVTNLWSQKVNDKFCSSQFLSLSQELFECAGNSKQRFFNSQYSIQIQIESFSGSNDNKSEKVKLKNSLNSPLFEDHAVSSVFSLIVV